MDAQTTEAERPIDGSQCSILAILTGVGQGYKRPSRFSVPCKGENRNDTPESRYQEAHHRAQDFRSVLDYETRSRFMARISGITETYNVIMPLRELIWTYNEWAAGNSAFVPPNER